MSSDNLDIPAAESPLSSNDGPDDLEQSVEPKTPKTSSEVKAATEPEQTGRFVPESNTGKSIRIMFGVIAIVHSILMLVQPVLGGMSMDGNTAALELHYMNGMFIMTIAILQTIAAALWWRPGDGPIRPLIITAVLAVLQIVQFFIGDSANYTVHLPLGIFVLFGVVGTVSMAFRAKYRVQHAA